MFDRIFSGLLTFSLLMAGTLAVGSALFGRDAHVARAPATVIELPRVTVTGQRTALAIDGGVAKVAHAQEATDCAITRTTTPTAAPATGAAPALTHI